MKRFASVLLAIALVVSLTSSVFAQTPTAKLGRGLLNTLTGLWEIPVQMITLTKSEGAATGLTVGFVKGIVMGAYRTLVGLYEVVTFPIPAPAGYEAITDPATLMTSETLNPADPSMRSDFRLLSDEVSGTK